MTFETETPFAAWLLNCGDGSSYLVRDSDGAIIRTDIKGFQPSGQWLVRGVAIARPFGRVGHWAPFLRDWRAKFLALEREADSIKGRGLSPLGFKNGKPKYFLEDLDHGTARVQMSGIRNVRGPFLYTYKPQWGVYECGAPAESA